MNCDVVEWFEHPDYYARLGLTADSTRAEIKKNYRKLVLQWHPDHNSSPNAQTVFVNINEAYSTLIDEVKRKQYDHRHDPLDPSVKMLDIPTKFILSVNQSTFFYNEIVESHNNQANSDDNLRRLLVLVLTFYAAIAASRTFYELEPSMSHALSTFQNTSSLAISSITFLNVRPYGSFELNSMGSRQLTYRVLNMMIEIEDHRGSMVNNLRALMIAGLHRIIRMQDNRSNGINDLSSEYNSQPIPRSFWQPVPTAPIVHPEAGNNQQLFDAAGGDMDEVPDHLICPLSSELFTDPVKTPYMNNDNDAFERSFVERYLEQVKAEDPLTRNPLHKNQLQPHKRLAKEARDFVADYIKQKQEQKEKLQVVKYDGF